MELRQLRYLVAIADERHFTRAAMRVNVAQPALSRQLRRLEAELGVPLVDRTTRQVRLTAMGDRLVERARRILDEVDAARREIGELHDLSEGEVSVGMTPTPGALNSAHLLGEFHRRHPRISLAVREELSVALIDLLRADHLDVAFITTSDDRRHEGLVLERVGVEDLLLAVAPEHRLERRDHVTVRELADEPLIAFAKGATIRGLVERAAREAGAVLRVSFESSDTTRIRALVAAGLGVAVLPSSDIASPGPLVSAVPLEPMLRHEVFVATRRDRSLAPAAEAFLRLSRAWGRCEYR